MGHSTQTQGRTRGFPGRLPCSDLPWGGWPKRDFLTRACTRQAGLLRAARTAIDGVMHPETATGKRYHEAKSHTLPSR